MLLLIAGAGSGWIIGRLFIGPSGSGIIQPAAMVGQLPAASAADKNESVAGNEAAKDTARNAEDGDASATAPAREGQPPAYSAPTQQDHGGRFARRYSRGRGFQPTSIVTKPARVISKPFKKLNPLKIF